MWQEATQIELHTDNMNIELLPEQVMEASQSSPERRTSLKKSDLLPLVLTFLYWPFQGHLGWFLFPSTTPACAPCSGLV